MQYTKYGARRAVGTHYWPTLVQQACYSLCHQRDCNAGTTILYNLVMTSDDYGQDGAVGVWALPPLPPGPQDLSGTASRMEQRAD